jgi:hypothetical protein
MGHARQGFKHARERHVTYFEGKSICLHDAGNDFFYFFFAFSSLLILFLLLSLF